MKPAPMTDFDVMQHIGNEFPLPLVQPIVIQKIETVVSAIIAARDAQWAELLSKREPVAIRHSFDGYGWLYMDNGSGSDWLKQGMNMPDAEAVYTHPAPQQEKP